MQRLAQLEVRGQDVEGIFLRHLHPARGTQKMMSKLEEGYDFDIRICLSDDREAPNGVLLLA